mgnify:CR=1 FL=1
MRMPQLSQSDSISIADKARQARSVTHETLTSTERQSLRQQSGELLAREDAVLVAHYYVDSELQELAEETGGCVADSLEMARFGLTHPASTVVVAGVRFMGETAKILSPEKQVLVVEPQAECSLDLGCPPAAFSAFCDQHPERTVVVYANTSAEVKARADALTRFLIDKGVDPARPLVIVSGNSIDHAVVRYGAMGGLIFIFGQRVLWAWARLPLWLRQLVLLGVLVLFAVMMGWAIYLVAGGPSA